MQRQFSQHSFSPATDVSSYLYEAPRPPLWRRLAPLVVVLGVGAATCFLGLSTGKKMADQVTELDTVQADPQLTQKVTIGADNPDLMMPQPTFAPPTMVAVAQPKRIPRGVQRAGAARSASKPAFDPFKDNTIPFQPAEDYAPEAEIERTAGRVESQTTEVKTDAIETSENAGLKTSAPEQTTLQVSAPQDSASPVPVAE
jgi:hypothetical protein